MSTSTYLRMKKLFIPIIALSSFLATAALDAWTINILTPEFPSSDSDGGYVMPDGKGMTYFTNILQSSGAEFATESLSSFAFENTDAVIINLINSGKKYSDAEIAVLDRLIKSNVRVLLIGENNSWRSSNNQLAALLGGKYTGEKSDAQATTSSDSAIGNLIIQGVDSVHAISPGSMGLGSGDGHILTSDGVISLWGAEDNILLSMDVNIFAEGSGKNAQLLQNIADFLNYSAPIPEPSTWALMIGTSALGLAVIRHRKVKPKK